MGVIKPIKFNVESFQEQASWIGGFFSTLNQFIGDTVLTTTNNVTVRDNLFQEIKEIKFKNDTNNFPMKFKTKFNFFPQGLMNIYLFNNTIGSMAVPSVTPYIQWTFKDNEIIISSITGLTASTTYTIRILVIYG
jgi:hypothetical protein